MKHFVWIFWVLIMGCQPQSKDTGQKVPHNLWQPPYDLSKPTSAVSLPAELNEISGLATLNNDTIACIQDEEGKVFILDHLRGQIEMSIQFGEAHDYEGISWVDGDAFVMQSNGKLYQIKDFGQADQQTILHRTFLKKANNTEGLAYDPDHNRLLISCRGIPGDEKSLKSLITIYQFDLSSYSLDSVPVISFSIDDIYQFLGIDALQKNAEKGANLLVPGIVDKVIFHPSGIAIHPFSGDLYVVAGQSNAIMVLNPEGEIKYLDKLDVLTFPKPEGITFLPSGDLLIANEVGENGREFSTIFRFRYSPAAEE